MTVRRLTAAPLYLLSLWVLPAAAQDACSTALGAQCGTSQGFSCCEDGAFCQPWDENFYQCIAVPMGCSTMETDVDYYGADISSHFGMKLPSDCCDLCNAEPECEFFTFINTWGPACYLKKGAGTKQTLKGALSGRKISSSSTPSVTPSPSSTSPSPATCAAELENDVDYYGNDLRSVSDVDLGDCCDSCNYDADCRVFTYVPSSRACYLKTSDAGRTASAGLVSGKRLGDVPPPAPSAAPTPAPSPAPVRGDWDSARCGTQKLDIYFHGNDIAGSEKAFDTLEECCDYCRSNDKCNLFTYFRRGSQKRCLLKTGMQSAEKTRYDDRDGLYVASGAFT